MADGTIGYTDRMVQDVCDAWTTPGQHYGYHKHLQDNVRESWPALADAIETLVSGTGKKVEE